MKKREGICHICLKDGPLTDEHVPPRAAYNKGRFRAGNLEKLMKAGPGSSFEGSVKQGGVKFPRLCAQCNNTTGDWYATSYLDWVAQAMHHLIKSDGKPALSYIYHLHPLRVIKQVVCMFLVINSPEFSRANPWLSKFVLSRNQKCLPSKYRFFVYYKTDGMCKYLGLTGIYNKRINLLSEISFPPFGFVMAIDTLSPDHRLAEITCFSEYSDGEFASVSPFLRVLPNNFYMPADFRTLEEIENDRILNESDAKLKYHSEEEYQDFVASVEQGMRKLQAQGVRLETLIGSEPTIAPNLS